jgi:DNA recombination protein RmuC
MILPPPSPHGTISPMQTAIIILLFVLIGAVLWIGSRLGAGNTAAPENSQSMLMIQQQINDLSKSLGDRMGDTHTAVRQSFAATANIVRDITEKMTRLDETNKQVLDVTGQLQQLQDILKNPKHRGIVGEYYLETLLQNVLPPGGYQMQYAFPEGDIVDAVVFVKDKIVPIDSKFSLENYNRLVEATVPAERDRLEKLFVGDLKKRIIETSKYIRPEEGTMDFAFMFIPHEAIYYDLLINKIGALQDDPENIMQRAAGTYHVIIVSPTSFLAYLQTVLQGLRGMAIEEQAKEIKKRVLDLKRHLSAYQERFDGVGRALGTASNQYELATKEFAKIDKDVLRISADTPVALEEASEEESV